MTHMCHGTVANLTAKQQEIKAKLHQFVIKTREKQFPMNPPYPLEITAFEPPLPLGISNGLPWGGGGMDIFWNHTICRLNLPV